MTRTYEIECKAWVDDPEGLRKRLHERYTFRTTYLKDDTYYQFPGRKQTFRVRNQDDGFIVTMKEKSRKDGMEDNLETEFSVSDVDSFVKFIEEFNCPVYLKKRKKSEVFSFGSVTLELSHVDTLGWFIEIEQLIQSENPRDKEKAKETIADILEDLEIPAEKIEERYYTELLTGIDENRGDENGNASGS